MNHAGGTLKRDTHLLADINKIFNIAAFFDPCFKDLDPFIPKELMLRR